ncbi:MAG: DUF2283 domain-containing protein [Nanoarchaeota archaeon]|nr:DUF2283 domain-containing protein [Nanoarchaeota archaeon]
MANTKDIKPRHLEAEGEMDYDYVNDILFFKLKNREYDFSIEFQNMVIDVDSEKFITGIQIFEASEFLGISRVNLRAIPKWQFKSRIDKGVIELRLNYQVEIRNKIYEKSPIIIQENKSGLPSPQMVQTC